MSAPIRRSTSPGYIAYSIGCQKRLIRGLHRIKRRPDAVVIVNAELRGLLAGQKMARIHPGQISDRRDMRRLRITLQVDVPIERLPAQPNDARSIVNTQSGPFQSLANAMADAQLVIAVFIMLARKLGVLAFTVARCERLIR